MQFFSYCPNYLIFIPKIWETLQNAKYHQFVIVGKPLASALEKQLGDLLFDVIKKPGKSCSFLQALPLLELLWAKSSCLNSGWHIAFSLRRKCNVCKLKSTSVTLSNKWHQQEVSLRRPSKQIIPAVSSRGHCLRYIRCTYHEASRIQDHLQGLKVKTVQPVWGLWMSEQQPTQSLSETLIIKHNTTHSHQTVCPSAVLAW